MDGMIPDIFLKIESEKESNAGGDGIIRYFLLTILVCDGCVGFHWIIPFLYILEWSLMKRAHYQKGRLTVEKIGD